jgi:hypothetical protein
MCQEHLGGHDNDGHYRIATDVSHAASIERVPIPRCRWTYVVWRDSVECFATCGLVK